MYSFANLVAWEFPLNIQLLEKRKFLAFAQKCFWNMFGKISFLFYARYSYSQKQREYYFTIRFRTLPTKIRSQLAPIKKLIWTMQIP